jgi:hypothetical protein
MPDRDAMLRELYAEKRECVAPFPEWLLPPGKISQYRAIARLALVEIAGRDSVAAAVKAVQERGFTDLVPTYAYTGTEHGSFQSVERAVERLAKRLPGTRIHELLLMGSPRFWQALNGRFVHELVSRYGLFLPCVGCHLYLHSVRIPLARLLGGVPLISGERESHDGAVKINQIAEALTEYVGLAGEFETELILPLRHMHDGNRVSELLGFEWKEGGEQLGCVLSGNYRDVDGDVRIESRQVRQYLKEFACPVTRKIVRAYVQGRMPDHLRIAAQAIGP